MIARLAAGWEEEYVAWQRRDLSARRDVYIWADGVGQKNKISQRWAKRGSRPSAPKDQRTKWAHILGAICSAKGKGAGLVMPWADIRSIGLREWAHGS